MQDTTDKAMLIELGRRLLEGSLNDAAIQARHRSDARIIFRRVTGSAQSIIFRGASVAAIVDDMASWKIADELLLDGFYETELTPDFDLNSKIQTSVGN